MPLYDKSASIINRARRMLARPDGWVQSIDVQRKAVCAAEALHQASFAAMSLKPGAHKQSGAAAAQWEYAKARTIVQVLIPGTQEGDRCGNLITFNDAPETTVEDVDRLFDAASTLASFIARIERDADKFRAAASRLYQNRSNPETAVSRQMRGLFVALADALDLEAETGEEVVEVFA